jgi:hypothetical protein
MPIDKKFFQTFLRGDIHNRKTTPQLAKSGSRQECIIDTSVFKPLNQSMVLVHYSPGFFLAKLAFKVLV